MGKNNQLLKFHPDFVYYDVTRVTQGGANTKWKRHHINAMDELRTKMIELNSKHCYATIQRFSNVKHVEGEPYISPLYFDLDSDDDLQESLDDIRKLKDYSNIGLDLEDGVKYFFSGNRGFHLEMSAELFGFRPNNELSKVLRHMAESVADKLSLKTFDRSVYSKRRMWRMTNTQHGKTGLWKIPLTPTEIGTLNVGDIRDLAKSPREIVIDDE